MCGQEFSFLGAVRTGAEVDVVRAQPHSGELRVSVSIFHGCPTADENSGVAVCRGQSGAGHAEGFRPGSRPQLVVFVADQWRSDAIALRGVGERPATLVAVPL